MATAFVWPDRAGMMLSSATSPPINRIVGKMGSNYVAVNLAISKPKL